MKATSRLRRGSLAVACGVLLTGLMASLSGCGSNESKLSSDDEKAFAAKDRAIPADIQAKIAAGQAAASQKMQQGAAKGGPAASGK